MEIFWVALGVGYEKGVMIFCDTCFFRSTAFKNDIFIQISCNQRKASAEKRSLMPGLLPTWSESASEAGREHCSGPEVPGCVHQDAVNLPNGALSHSSYMWPPKSKDAPHLVCSCVFSFSSGNMEKLQIIGRDVSSRWSLTVPVEGAFSLLEYRLKRNVPLNEWVSLK